MGKWCNKFLKSIQFLHSAHFQERFEVPLVLKKNPNLGIVYMSSKEKDLCTTETVGKCSTGGGGKKPLRDAER